jgi:Tfp pilus assembly protein PilN
MGIINLLPQDYIAGRYRRRANWVCSILFAVVMAGVVGAAFVSDQSRRHTLEVSRRVDGDYAEAAKLIAQMQQLELQKTLMLTKAGGSSALMERVPRSFLLGMLTNSLPKGASLSAVELDTRRTISSGPAPAKAPSTSGGPPSPPPTPPLVVVMDVKGLASTDVEVARFIANLARNPLAASVDLAYSQEKLVDGSSMREFQIKIELKNNSQVDAKAVQQLTMTNGQLSIVDSREGGRQ